MNDKDAEMKHKLTRATALILAGMLACNANAAEDDTPTKEADPTVVDATRLNRERAREATEQAARQAVQAVLESTKLDLDIRLIGPNSVKIAGDH